jgi:DNA repair protein RecO (recombination protein O)
MPDTSRTRKVEAIVLRHSDWGEADRLLVLFTRELGKVRAIAKGVRRMRSRKAGHLEPYTRASLVLAKGRDLWIVTQASTLEPYLALRADLLRTGYTAYVFELMDRFTFEEGENQSLFALLEWVLEHINTEADPFLAVRYYEMRLLELLGFRPQLFKCTRCEKKIAPEDQFFSAENGGVLCPACGGSIPSARPVTTETLKYMRHLQRSKYDAVLQAKPSPATREQMETLLQYYFTWLLERRLNTPEFLRSARE